MNIDHPSIRLEFSLRTLTFACKFSPNSPLPPRIPQELRTKFSNKGTAVYHCEIFVGVRPMMDHDDLSRLPWFICRPKIPVLEAVSRLLNSPRKQFQPPIL